MLMNFHALIKLKGMGQIVIADTFQDEDLHCEGIVRLFHEFVENAIVYHRAAQEGYHPTSV